MSIPREPFQSPLEQLPFPVVCSYPDCSAGPFKNAIEVDEHVTEEHLMEAVWDFAMDYMKGKKP